MTQASVSETVVARTFLGRWLRRGLLAGFGVGFTVPYFAILNDVHVEGDEVLKDLPRRNVVFLANHQTYFLEAIAFFDLVYVRHQMPLESPIVRFSAAEETMKQNLLTKLMTLAGGVTFKRNFREAGQDVNRAVDLDGVARVEEAIRDGWLLHKQVPGKLFKQCSLKIHPPLPLQDFYAAPYQKSAGTRVLRQLEETIGDSPA